MRNRQSTYDHSDDCSFCGKNKSDGLEMIKGPGGLKICEECIELSAEIIADNKAIKNEDRGEVNPKDLKKFTPQKIKEHLDNYVIGQEDSKTILSVAVYNHYKRINAPKSAITTRKSNVLLVGPSGSGKTLFAQQIAKLLNVPFTSADATSLTEAGYVGEDVETILAGLIKNANGDIEKAERGIVFIDEVDKIRKTSWGGNTTTTVGGEGVQQALLKMLEGNTVKVSMKNKRKHPEENFEEINTSNILFICAGAFVGLEDIVKADNCEMKDASVDHLIKFGMIPEFMGRLPVVSVLNQLTEDDLVHILTQPKDAIVKEYQQMLKQDRVDLRFSPEALKTVARKAIANNTGARGLRAILEKALTKLMFEAPSIKEKRIIELDEDLDMTLIEEKVEQTDKSNVIDFKANKQRRSKTTKQQRAV